MTASLSPGALLRQAVRDEQPLQVVGTINAYHAIMAEKTGYRALYLLHDVCEDVRRITYVTQTPLLVDADTGMGPSAFNIERTVRDLMRAGAAGCHIEDQVQAKRCGHRPGKAIVSQGEMVDRIKAAADMTSSSWPAPTPWRWRASSPPSTAPAPASRPGRT